MGGPVELISWRDTVQEAAQLAPALKETGAAAALPLELLGDLLPLAGERPGRCSRRCPDWSPSGSNADTILPCSKCVQMR